MADENNATIVALHDVIIRLSRKYGGRWRPIYDALKACEDVSNEPDPTPEELLGWTPVTIFDLDTYPQPLAKSTQPPFVIYCKGDLSLLKAKSLLYVCQNRPGDNPHPAVDNLIWDVAREGIVPIVCWRPIKGGGQLATVLKAHETTGKPLIVFVPSSAKDQEKLADRVAAFGGLAVRESFPGSDRVLALEEDRTAAALCSACLVIGGDKGVAQAALMGCAVNDGKDVGAVAYAMGDPDGYLPILAAKSGATLVDSLSDVKALLEVE